LHRMMYSSSSGRQSRDKTIPVHREGGKGGIMKWHLFSLDET
jgi:hypothetical protein